MESTINRDVLLSQQMLPAIRHVAGENFVFQQDSAPAHSAHDTIQLLRCESVKLLTISPELWPPDSLDLNPVEYKIWGVIQDSVNETWVNNVDELRQ